MAALIAGWFWSSIVVYVPPYHIYRGEGALPVTLGERT